jgi:hypothetical protein
VDRNAKPFHKRARVLPEPLLAGRERIAVVTVLHLPLLQVGVKADIVMWREQEARSFSFQPFAYGRDFLGRRFLLGGDVVKAEKPLGCQRLQGRVRRSAV